MSSKWHVPIHSKTMTIYRKLDELVYEIEQYFHIGMKNDKSSEMHHIQSLIIKVYSFSIPLGEYYEKRLIKMIEAKNDDFDVYETSEYDQELENTK